MAATATVLALAAPALAQSGDADYCRALLVKYDGYISNEGRRSATQSLNPEARLSAEQCRSGNAAGIPGLEKALKDAKIDLPPRK